MLRVTAMPIVQDNPARRFRTQADRGRQLYLRLSAVCNAQAAFLLTMSTSRVTSGFTMRAKSSYCIRTVCT